MTRSLTFLALLSLMVVSRPAASDEPVVPSPAAESDPAAPPPPPDDVYLLTGRFLLETDGTTDATARIWAKGGRPGYLVQCGSLSSLVLLDPTSRAVRSLDADLVVGVGDEGKRVLPGAGGESLCELVPDGPTAGFTVGGHDFRLVPAPHVLGPVTPKALLAGSPEYRRTAADYQPSDKDIATLKAMKTPVRVDVFFGSWCGFCSRFMPRLLRVVQDADNPALSFTFHGVPRQITLDPDASALGVTAVPTAVIFAGGQEVGRLEGTGWHQPEVALAILLGRLG